MATVNPKLQYHLVSRIPMDSKNTTTLCESHTNRREAERRQRELRTLGENYALVTREELESDTHYRR